MFSTHSRDHPVSIPMIRGGEVFVGRQMEVNEFLE